METLFLIIDNSILITYNFLVITLLLGFSRKMYQSNLVKLGVALFTVILLCIFTILSFSFETFIMLELFIVQIPLYLIFKRISKFCGLKLLFVILSGWVWYMPIMTIGNLVATPFDYDIRVKMIAHIVCIPILLFLIQSYFTPIYRYMLEHISKGWHLFCLIPMICMAITYISSYFAIALGLTIFRDSMVWRYLVYALMFLIYLLMIMSFKQIREQLVMQKELELYRLQLEGASDHIGSLKTSLKLTTMQQHDLRHHLQFISSKATLNDTDAIQNYIGRIQEDISTAKPILFCQNETLNLILTAFHNKAENDGIDLQVKGHLPEIIHIPDVDLCILISNALENAIRATRSVVAEQRRITLSMHVKNEQAFFEVSNPYTGKIIFNDGLPSSSREGGGTGTRSIAYIATKYDGFYDFRLEGNRFILQIVL